MCMRIDMIAANVLAAGWFACAATATPAVRTVPAPDPPPLMLQGYYPSWCQQKFPPSQIGLDMLTHVCHSFVSPSATGALTVPKDFLLPDLVSLAHARGKKVVLGVGGGDASAHFSRMATNAALRTLFVRALSRFVASNHYDGVELDWEFPRNEADRVGFILLVSGLRASLDPRRSMSLAVSASRFTSRYTDVAALAPSIDHFIVMAYDCHGGWSEYSGHNAPLNTYPRCDGSVKEGVQYWLKRGMPRNKLVLGVPFYGRAFASKGAGRSFTECNNLDYREVLQLINRGYVRHWDATACVPYLNANVGTQFVTFDDPQSLALKVDLVLNSGFAGVAAWQVTGDIVDGRHTLLPGIRQRLAPPLKLLGNPQPHSN